jgi:glycosyltransferase involved in cell wall biosynthesis
MSLKLACDLSGLDESRPYGEVAFGRFLFDLLSRSNEVEIVEAKQAEAILSLDGRFRPGHGQLTATTVTDLGCFLARSAYPIRDRLRLQWRVISAALRSHRVLVPSEAVRQALERYFHLPSQRMTVLEPVPARTFRRASQEQARALRAELGLPPRYFHVTFDHSPGSNQKILEQAWRLAVPHLGPQVGLIVTGSTRLTMTGAIELGSVPTERLPALLSGALGWLCPSLYEGSSIRALEAMACGAVPIVSGRGALARAVDGTGLIADPTQPSHWARAMIDLAGDAELHASLSRAGLRAVGERRAHPPQPDILLSALRGT